MRKVVSASLVTALLVTCECVATTVVRLGGQSPPVQLLRAVRGDSISKMDAETTVRACLDLGLQSRQACLQSTGRVLQVLALGSSNQRAEILAGLQEAESAGYGSAEGDMIRRIAGTIGSTGKEAEALSTKSHRRLRDYYAGVAAGAGPPTKKDIGTLPQTVFDARLFTYVDTLLGTDPDRRVQGAFAAATSRSCGGLLEGKGEELCQELGLWTVQRALLRTVFEQLYESEGEDKVISRFLAIDRAVAANVFMRVRGGDDDVLGSYVDILERWLERRPTRWQAWADIEEVLAPQYQ